MGNAVTATQNSITSAPLSTTNANDILILAVDVSANQSGTNNSFVPSAGFAFPASTATDVRQAVAYEIISSLQTNLTASMSWGTSGQSSSEFIAFKAAAATGPPALQSVSVNPSTVIGGQSSTGTVTLTGAAPTGGAVMNVSSNSTSAQVPASGTVTVLEGTSSANFTITTSSVSASTPVTISASYNGGSAQTASLTVNPLAVQSLSLNPTSVVGGQNSPSSTGTVTLNGPAPNGGAVVNVSSDNAAAQPSSATVTVAANQTSATFSVSTTAVSSTTQATISANYNGGTSKSAILTINPVGVASPLSVVQAQQNFNTKASTSITASIATSSGKFAGRLCPRRLECDRQFHGDRQPGPSWTLGGYISSGSTERSGIYYLPNSAVVSSVTANFSTAAG